MATYAEKLATLRQFVQQGQFGLAGGDIKDSSGRGGMETTRQVLKGILDLLNQTSAGGECCCCWEEIVDKTAESVEPAPLDGVTYVVQEEDLGKLLVFEPCGLPAAPPPPEFIIQDIQLPPADDLDICTKIGITCRPGNLDEPDWVNLITDPWGPLSIIPVYTEITSPVSPLMGLSPVDPNRPGILLGELPDFVTRFGWFLLEFVVASPGDFAVPDGKGWWLKDIDIIMDVGAIPPPV